MSALSRIVTLSSLYSWHASNNRHSLFNIFSLFIMHCIPLSPFKTGHDRHFADSQTRGIFFFGACSWHVLCDILHTWSRRIFFSREGILPCAEFNVLCRHASRSIFCTIELRFQKGLYVLCCGRCFFVHFCPRLHISQESQFCRPMIPFYTARIQIVLVQHRQFQTLVIMISDWQG